MRLEIRSRERLLGDDKWRVKRRQEAHRRAPACPHLWGELTGHPADAHHGPPGGTAERVAKGATWYWYAQIEGVPDAGRRST